MSENEAKDVSAQPLITYTNRLQKQMGVITILLSDNSVGVSTIVQPLRALLRNLPPQSNEALKEDICVLERFDRDTSVFRSKLDLEQMYGRIHNWCYLNLFEDVFKAKPVYKKKGHLTV